MPSRRLFRGPLRAFILGAVILQFAQGMHVAIANANTCGAPRLDADIGAPAGFSSDSAISLSFNNARSAEGCTGAFTLPNGYDGMSPEGQMLTLFNAERIVRGFASLTLDTGLLSPIDRNHSREMADYNYFNHPSPINSPDLPSNLAFWGPVFARDVVNPVVGNAAFGLAENIAAMPNAAAAVYAYMYQDAAENWGHRGNILGCGYSASGPVTPCGNYNWVGIGAVHSTHADAYYPNIYFSSDFLDGNYTPPSTPDAAAPSLNPPTASGAAATVTGVADTGAGTNVAGVTTVVFYVDRIFSTSTGQQQTVRATQSSAGTWTATLPNPVPSGSVLHAVAVDGSGNYTDCPATAGGLCGPAGPGPALTASPLTQGWNSLGIPTNAYSHASNLVSDLQGGNTGMSVGVVATYAEGKYSLYVPGYSADFLLIQGMGVDVLLNGDGQWTPLGTPAANGIGIPLQRGWNFISIPYPSTLSASTICSEISGSGMGCTEVAVYTSTGYTTYVPTVGATNFTVDRKRGFMVLVNAGGTWTPA